MTQDDAEEKSDLVVKGYQDKIEMLTNIISNLETQKRELDVIVANHQATTIDYKRNQVLLDSIVQDIELKKGIQATTTEEMSVLNQQKFSLEKEVAILELDVQKKKEYTADIEKLANQIVILQKEMAGFQDEHSANKKNALQEMENIKSEIKKLHQGIGLIIS
jgi:hypothetical protein